MSSDKMSKSSGNFLTLSSLIEDGYSPMDYRFFLLMAHYRSKLTFTFEALKGAAKARKRLMEKIRNLASQLEDNQKSQVNECLKKGISDSDQIGSRARELLENFKIAISDDLNSPRGIATVQEIVKDDLVSSTEKCMLLADIDRVLGLHFDVVLSGNESEKTDAEPNNDIPEEVMKLAAQREEARKNKDWALSDQLRDQIKEAGFAVEDSKDGQRISKA